MAVDAAAGTGSLRTLGTTALKAAAGDHSHAGGTAPVFGRVASTAGNLTTTSTTLVDVTGATITFTTGAFPVRYSAAQSAQHSTPNIIYFSVDVDGTLLHGTSGIGEEPSGVNFNKACSFSGQTAALTAAAHTLKMQWRTDLGTATLRRDATVSHMFSAEEIS
jgi:hypothetical protein